eukprot:13845638-Heterocapsa_arctica.AAC.1
MITPKKDGVIITPKKIEKAVQETMICLDKHQPAKKDEFEQKQQKESMRDPKKYKNIKHSGNLDIPIEIKSGYSPIGFVRCGRA